MTYELSTTYFTLDKFEAKPQIGTRIDWEWDDLREWLTTPRVGKTKKELGAWSPCALVGGAVKDGTGDVGLFVADVDVCTKGAIERHARILDRYAGVIVSTFNATEEVPKHRLVLLPDRAFRPKEFQLAWAKVYRDMLDADIILDKSCKNINRLYFTCMTKSADAWFEARILTGDPVPVEPLLESAREFVDHEKKLMEQRRKSADARVATEHKDRYVLGALARARANVINATEGNRHGTLIKEAYGLARFNISEAVIHDTLYDAFIACAGPERAKEGERSVGDAVRARHNNPNGSTR